MGTASSAGRGRDTKWVDAALMSELVGAMSTRAVGRKLRIEQHDLVATVTSLMLEPSDYSVSGAVTSGLETGLATLGEVNNAARRGVGDANPMRAGMRIIDALAKGIDRAIEASPINPLDGSMEVLESSSVEFADLRFGPWEATSVHVTVGKAIVAVEPGVSTLRLEGIELTALLTSRDVEAIVEGLGHSLDGELSIEGSRLWIDRRVGPLGLRIPITVSLEGTRVVVAADSVLIAKRSVRLPSKLAKRFTIESAHLPGGFTVEKLAVADSRVRVELSFDDVQEPVTVHQVRELIRSVQGADEVRLERISRDRRGSGE